MINGNIEKPLYGACMQIHGQDAIRASDRNKIGDQLRADWDSRLVFPILPSIPEIRDDRCDAKRRRPFERIQHDQQFHDRGIGRVTTRLNDEHVTPAHVLFNFDPSFAVAECRDGRLGQRDL